MCLAHRGGDHVRVGDDGRGPCIDVDGDGAAVKLRTGTDAVGARSTDLSRTDVPVVESQAGEAHVERGVTRDQLLDLPLHNVGDQRVLAHRERNRDEFARQGAPLTLTAYFLQAAVAAIRAVPEANSHWTDSALEIFDSIHMGVATAIDDELVVPVLRNLETLDLLETARGLHNLVTRARERMLTPADMRGGTFTISNHGVSGSLLATPIVINQPQSAILGVGKLERRVVVDSGEKETLSVQSRCYVTLTIDHRVLDGYRANRFLQSFVGCLAHWPASPTKAHDVHAGT